MTQLLPIIQIIISALLIGAVLLQRRSGGLSPAFGGDGGAYRTRRGIEQWLFITTIILAVLFIAAALLNIILR
ncbi:MAG: preprotein translocase subunit SecG [Candidatus Sungiibacteriota bacterium]